MFMSCDSRVVATDELVPKVPCFASDFIASLPVQRTLILRSENKITNKPVCRCTLPRDRPACVGRHDAYMSGTAMSVDLWQYVSLGGLSCEWAPTTDSATITSLHYSIYASCHGTRIRRSLPYHACAL